MLQEILNISGGIIQFTNKNGIGLLTLFVASATLIYIWQSRRKEELAVLRSLFQHLKHIKDTAQGQDNQMRMGGPVPSWTLIDINLNFYLPKINYKIKAEGLLSFGDVYTKKLKKLIINVSHNINKINNLINLMYRSEVNNQLTNKMAYKNELLDKAPYYSELYQFVNDAHSELKKILKPL